MSEKANCLCRHGEHAETPCFWESPGGGLIGLACDCETYQACPHPVDKRGSNNYHGNPTCGQCAQHFESEEAYVAAQGLPADRLEHDKAVWVASMGLPKLVSFPAKIPERNLLKMRIAQEVRDLDEQGLHNVLAAIAAERARKKTT